MIEDLGNPFAEESTDLLILDSKEIIDQIVVDSILNAQKNWSRKISGICQGMSN